MFRARLDQIINMKHELVQLADKIDWEFIDGEIAPLYSDQGRPGIETLIGLLLLKHIYGLSDECVCERWVYDPTSSTSPGRSSRGHDAANPRCVFISGQKRGCSAASNASSDVAPPSRHGDRPHEGRRSSRSLLSQGRVGDAANAIVSAVGYNLRLLLLPG